MVLKNYDGENLGEFRQNLSTYGAVKVRTIDGAMGGVETLSIQVNAEDYKGYYRFCSKKGNKFEKLQWDTMLKTIGLVAMQPNEHTEYVLRY